MATHAQEVFHEAVNISNAMQAAMDVHAKEENRRRALMERAEYEMAQQGHPVHRRPASTLQMHTFLDSFLEPPQRHGRKLEDKSAVFDDLPEWYTKQHAWVSQIQWKDHYKRLLQLAEIDRQRMRWWRDGQPGSQDEMPPHLMTGNWLLDMRAPPTPLGRALRLRGASKRSCARLGSSR